MKRTNTCPKCGSREIIRVPGLEGGFGPGNIIQLGMALFKFNAIDVTRYVCGHCGYSEEWIDNPDDLEKIKGKFGRNSG